MYRKIFRAISPKENTETFHQESPLYLLLKRDLQHFLSARFCNNLGLVLNPSSRPFMTSASGAIRGYQGREKAVYVNLQSPVWWKLFEWKQQSWSVGPPLFNGKINVWENQPVEWIQHPKIKESETLPLGWQYWAFFRWVATAFKAVSLATSIFAELPVTWKGFLESGFRMVWNLPRSWFFSRVFFSHLQCDGLKLDKFFEEKIHSSLVRGFCRDGSTLIGSAIWERNITLSTLPIDWINTRETDDRI